MASTLLAVQTSSRNPSVHTEVINSDQIVPECSDFEVRDEDMASQDCSVSFQPKAFSFNNTKVFII